MHNERTAPELSSVNTVQELNSKTVHVVVGPLAELEAQDFLHNASHTKR
jgi:hypothetical protein